MKKTVVLSLGAAALLLIGGISVYAHQTSDSGESETVYKETTAEYGTLTVGITESGSVTIGSISQDMAEDISTARQVEPRQREHPPIIHRWHWR